MKKLACLGLLLSIAFLTSSFTIPRKFKTGILFNKEPFTKETIGNYSRSFERGTRIYWLFMSNKPIKAQYIRVQVSGATDKGPFNTINKIAYSHDYMIYRDSPHFFTDYVVLHSPGHYYMQVFDRNDLHYSIAKADFYVK